MLHLCTRLAVSGCPTYKLNLLFNKTCKIPTTTGFQQEINYFVNNCFEACLVLPASGIVRSCLKIQSSIIRSLNNRSKVNPSATSEVTKPVSSGPNKRSLNLSDYKKKRGLI